MYCWRGQERKNAQAPRLRRYRGYASRGACAFFPSWPLQQYTSPQKYFYRANPEFLMWAASRPIIWGPLRGLPPRVVTETQLGRRSAEILQRNGGRHDWRQLRHRKPPAGSSHAWHAWVPMGLILGGRVGPPWEAFSARGFQTFGAPARRFWESCGLDLHNTNLTEPGPGNAPHSTPKTS